MQFYPNTLAGCMTGWEDLRLLRAVLQIPEGTYLSADRCVLHRNLKEWNVLIDSFDQARLIDFRSTSGVMKPPLRDSNAI